MIYEGHRLANVRGLVLHFNLGAFRARMAINLTFCTFHHALMKKQKPMLLIGHFYDAHSRIPDHAMSFQQ